jgi:hypothetical protein
MFRTHHCILNGVNETHWLSVTDAKTGVRTLLTTWTIYFEFHLSELPDLLFSSMVRLLYTSEWRLSYTASLQKDHDLSLHRCNNLKSRVFLAHLFSHDIMDNQNQTAQYKSQYSLWICRRLRRSVGGLEALRDLRYEWTHCPGVHFSHEITWNPIWRWGTISYTQLHPHEKF